MKDLKVAVGQSFKLNSEEAGFEAAGQAIKSLRSAKPNLLVVFASSRFSQEKVVKGIKTFVKTLPVFGCSTAGEITHKGPAEKSVAVMALSASKLEFQVGAVKLGADSKTAAASLARDLKNRHQKQCQAFIVLPDTLSGNGDEIIHGLEEALEPEISVAGGSPADEDRFEKTFQYAGGEVIEDGIAALSIGGRISVGVAACHGWEPIGLPRVVTKAEKNLIYELDGEPAFNLYADYFLEKSEELFKTSLAKVGISYPLGLKVESADEYLVRYPVRAFRENGALKLSAPIKEGAAVSIMIGGRDQALAGARSAAKQVMRDLNRREPDFAFVFSSVARKKIYGADAKEEIDAVLQEFGRPDIPILGFYSYGEQASFETAGGANGVKSRRFYNESIAIIGFAQTHPKTKSAKNKSTKHDSD